MQNYCISTDLPRGPDLGTNTMLEQNKPTNSVESKDFYLLYTTLFSTPAMQVHSFYSSGHCSGDIMFFNFQKKTFHSIMPIIR